MEEQEQQEQTTQSNEQVHPPRAVRVMYTYGLVQAIYSHDTFWVVEKTVALYEAGKIDDYDCNAVLQAMIAYNESKGLPQIHEAVQTASGYSWRILGF